MGTDVPDGGQTPGGREPGGRFPADVMGVIWDGRRDLTYPDTTPGVERLVTAAGIVGWRAPLGARVLMRCASCRWEETSLPFTAHDQHADGRADFACDVCGWEQASEAGGAAEMCLAAEWGDDAESLEYYGYWRDLARAAGYAVPEAPRRLLSDG
jgi:hypothetical protein